MSPRGDFRSVEDIENVPIEIPDTGEVIRLRDLASVRRGYVDPPTAPVLLQRRAGRPDRRQHGRRPERARRRPPRVVERLEELEQLLPVGFQLQVGNYQPTHVERAVAAVRSNLFQTIAIVLVVIVGSWACARASSWACTSR